MTTAPPQQRYDHRLRELVQRTGNPTIATDRTRAEKCRMSIEIARMIVFKNMEASSSNNGEQEHASGTSPGAARFGITDSDVTPIARFSNAYVVAPAAAVLQHRSASPARAQVEYICVNF
jgi:hypothetical protein